MAARSEALKRTVTPEEVGDSGLYFLSHLSRGVTGEVHATFTEVSEGQISGSDKVKVASPGGAS